MFGNGTLKSKKQEKVLGVTVDEKLNKNAQNLEIPEKGLVQIVLDIELVKFGKMFLKNTETQPHFLPLKSK